MKANPSSIAANRYDDPEDRGGAPKVPAKGGHGIKAKTANKNNLGNNENTSVGTKKPVPLRALAAVAARGPSVTRSGGAGAIRWDGGTGMRPDKDVTAAAQLAIGFNRPMPNNAAKVAFEGFPGAKVVRRALAALRDDTNDEEEPGNDDEEDGVTTQDDNTEDNKTLGSKAPKVQQGSGRKAHQKTHEEAHYPAYGGGGTLGLSLDSEDGETEAPNARPGSLPVDKGRKAREDNKTSGGKAPKVQQGSGRKAHQKTHQDSHHPAYGGGGTLRLYSDGKDGETGAPDARSGSLPINKGEKVRALNARQDSLSSNTPKAN